MSKSRNPAFFDKYAKKSLQPIDKVGLSAYNPIYLVGIWIERINHVYRNNAQLKGKEVIYHDYTK